MSFRIGQRVRAIASMHPSCDKYIGAVGVIVGPEGPGLNGTHQPVKWERGAGAWDGKVGYEPVKCLEPIDDPSAFDTFMERVLKPVPLPVEIEA